MGERLKWILIDPGHGGKPGQGGSYGAKVGEVIEAPINLAVAHKLNVLVGTRAFLPDSAAEMTRRSDVGVNLRWRRLKEKWLVEREGKPGLVISLHCDSAHVDPMPRGMRCYYYPGNTISAAVADHILGACPRPLQRVNHPWHPNYIIKSIPADKENYTRANDVIANYEADCVLVEMGFLTNEHDREYLQDERMQWRIAAACLCGILAWSSEHRKKK